MTTFDLPGGHRLYPEPEYLAQRLEDANSDEVGDVLAEVLREAREGLNRLEDLHREIRDLARRERELDLDLRDLRQRRRIDPFRRQLDDDELDRMIDEKSAEQVEKAERRKELEEEFESRANHISRNFLALEVARGALDLTPPDVARIKAEVGEPVEAV